MANTYTLISKTVLTGTQSSISFTSIPSTYTDLLLCYSVRSNSGTDTVYAQTITFNGSSSSFSAKFLYAYNGSTGSYSNTTGSIGPSPSSLATSNTFGNASIYIPNYTSSNNKSFTIDNVSENNGTESELDLIAGLWSNTAAISSITIAPNSGASYVQYSSAYLYGIKNS